MNRELTELYFVHSIRGFSISLIGLFIPIFFLKQGFSLNYIFLFYLFAHIVFFLFNIPVLKFVGKFGVKHSIFLSSFLTIVSFTLIYNVKNFNIPVYVLGPLFALASMTYWSAFHIDFTISGNEKERTKELGLFRVFSLILNLFSPLIGGIIITVSSFKTLFIVADILFVVAVFPLFISKEIYEPFNISYKGVFKKILRKKNMYFFSEGIVHFSEQIIWPIFIYLIIKNLISLGFINTVMIFFVMIISYFVGKAGDLFDKKKMIALGSFFNSITWFVRGIVSSMYLFLTVSSFSGITYLIYHFPFQAMFYNRAKKKGIIEMISARETFMHLGKISIIVLMLLTNNLVLGFVYAGLSSITFMFM